MLGRMEERQDDSLDKLWREYAVGFRDFDDLTLARWMAQTLGQLQGKVWRYSHPLVGAYRLAAQLANERQVWLKRLASKPAAYADAPCCRAPLLPLLTRDIQTEGLLCLHCGEIAVPFADLPEDLQAQCAAWAEQYEPVHQVAHWEEHARRRVPNYDDALDKAADEAEILLADLRRRLAPLFLEAYPAVVWEDQDECLDVRPEDIAPGP